MSKIVDIRHVILLLCAAALTMGVGGCRESEQDRVLRFEQGKYLGKPDQQLTPAQVDELRQRARLQAS